MNFKTVLFSISCTFAIVSCQNTPKTNKESVKQDKKETRYVNDPHTYAQPNKAVVTHLDLELDVNFDKEILQGTAVWDVKTSDKAQEVIFDTYGLQIDQVKVNDSEADYELGSFEENLGRPLTVQLPEGAQKVSIAYQTTDSARALQWLDPKQTADENMPYLFTQSQAILARSWVPTQDSPGIRFTYDAKVSVPDSMLALMSASNPKEKNDDGMYNFRMKRPIPSYLLALAVGDIVFESISDRAGVYAEPSLIDTAAYEFADLEKMIKAAEDLYGPYVWDRYDIIVLPPSFPFGGMENPRLTFATPTILAGDRSLVSLVAHELAHSWSGNLVTNATWNDFWLNEGFTVYFEHRIMEEVYGRDYSEMLASLTRDGLQESAEEMMKDVPNDTKLKLNLEGRNPDEGVTSIPYDKGYFFLRLVEETVGRKEFDQFLHTYFDTFAFKVMNTERFLKYMKENLLTKKEARQIKIDEWVYETGIPDNLPEVESERFEAVDSTLAPFVENGQLPAESLTKKWTTHEWLHFINELPDDISKEKLAKLDEAYGFTQSGNSEIVAAWFQPTVRNNYEEVLPRVEEFLINVGRRKFLTPTYRALQESGYENRAMKIYQKARPNYHAVSRGTIDELLGYSESESA